MADRRMFSKSIIDSDLFLDMPQSAQCLYFHLSMRADDDGFVNAPKKIQRMIGASDDDCKILVAKRFIIPFETGIVVIRHWRIHNYIQKDRYKPTIYQDEKSSLVQGVSGEYDILDTSCIQGVSKMDNQLGKVSLGKSSIEEDTRSASASLDVRFARFWKAYPVKKAKQQALKTWRKIKPNEELTQVIIDAVERQKKWEDWKKDGGRYIPYPSTWLNQGRWEDEQLEVSGGENGTSENSGANDGSYKGWRAPNPFDD